MPAHEHYLERIERELATARAARAEGNNGKARVCSRRAAGAALSWFVTAAPRSSWGGDAMRQLLGAKDEPTFPADVRAAALRLTTRITEGFDYAYSSDPIEDAQVIIRHIRTVMEGGDAGVA